MIAAILGHPGSGKRTLGESLAAALPALRIITGETIRMLLASSSSAVAQRARAASETGALVPDAIMGALLAEAIGADGAHALLIGLPRSAAQLASLRAASGGRIHLIHLRASADLIDERRRALGQPPIDRAHPGALARLDSALDPMLAQASLDACLLSLDAASATSEQLRRSIGLFPMRT